MPKDSTPTKELLLDAGQHLFAARGLHSVSTKDIVSAANQKNTSALQYHFGGRDGLLLAILDRHNTGIEAERREFLDHTRGGDLRTLVTAIVVPMAHKLHSTGGREFLMIVAQLGERFGYWDTAPEAPAEAHRALAAIVAVLAGAPYGFPADIRHERATRLLALVSEALGSRARAETGKHAALDHDRFVTNLIDMSIGALTAPSTVTG